MSNNNQNNKNNNPEDNNSGFSNEQNSFTTIFRIQAAEILEYSEYCGELKRLDYSSAEIIVQDKWRQKCGGIPMGCFLIAARKEAFDKGRKFNAEDATFVLLRVEGSCALHNDMDSDRVRTEAAKSVTGREDISWDSSSEGIDGFSKHAYSYGGIKCKVLGTFYFEPQNDQLILKFGSDIENFYSNHGLKVFKPNFKSLESIVNYTDISLVTDEESKKLHETSVNLGKIRYSSTFRPSKENPINANFEIHPSDMLSQRTMVFGISRSGKSNTVKTIIKAIHELCLKEDLSVGQVIFDYNGEYANKNVQDKCSIADLTNKAGERGIVYALNNHRDPSVRVLKFNFHVDQNLQMGKEQLNELLEAKEGVQYIDAFKAVSFDNNNLEDSSTRTRELRRRTVYRTLLIKLGLNAPSDLFPSRDLVSQAFYGAIEEVAKAIEEGRAIRPKSNSFKDDTLTKIKNYKCLRGIKNWGEAEIGAETLWEVLTEGRKIQIKRSTGPNLYQESTVFDEEEGNEENIETESKEGNKKGGKSKVPDFWNPIDVFLNDYTREKKHEWADGDLLALLEFRQRPGAQKHLREAKDQHNPYTITEYSDDIYREVSEGKLVVIDFSAGSEKSKINISTRIADKIFKGNLEVFNRGAVPPKIQVYIEEAHNLLSNIEKSEALTNIWVRMSKEGSKFGLGVIAITQEPSSLPPNILKNAPNWFISHLNNGDEINTISAYYDLADFAVSIRKCPDVGFTRVRTLSSPFSCPVQINKFTI
jgi:Helicase HerA, central domain